MKKHFRINRVRLAPRLSGGFPRSAMRIVEHEPHNHWKGPFVDDTVHLVHIEPARTEEFERENGWPARRGSYFAKRDDE